MNYHIRRDSREKLLDGIFFQMEVPYDIEAEEHSEGCVLVGGPAQGHGPGWMRKYTWIVNDDDGTPLDRSRPSCERCHADGVYTFMSHFVQSTQVVVFFGPAESGIFPLQEPSTNLFVTSALAARLRQSRLSGIDFGKVTRARRREDGTVQENPAIEVVNRVGKGRQWHRFVLSEGTPNACPFCGHSPILCPSCGVFRATCTKCKKSITTSSTLHKGKGDQRLMVEARLNETPTLDGATWDGSDFTSDGFITKRALDFLQSVHAAPFYYRPALVNVANVNEMKRRQILAAKEPLCPGE